MTLFIGDVHGLFPFYENIIRGRKDTIQLGDMGVGFPDGGYPDWDMMREGNHRFIRGNHDNPRVCFTHTQCIKDGTVEEDMMFIGGAVSIDKAYRREGYSWWPEEEMSVEKGYELLDKYNTAKPRIMVTHECPESISYYLLVAMSARKLDFPSVTRQVFESMFHYHKPKLWIFAHWHFSFDRVIDGCRFICLNELETKEFDF